MEFEGSKKDASCLSFPKPGFIGNNITLMRPAPLIHRNAFYTMDLFVVCKKKPVAEPLFRALPPWSAPETFVLSQVRVWSTLLRISMYRRDTVLKESLESPPHSNSGLHQLDRPSDEKTLSKRAQVPSFHQHTFWGVLKEVGKWLNDCIVWSVSSTCTSRFIFVGNCRHYFLQYRLQAASLCSKRPTFGFQQPNTVQQSFFLSFIASNSALDSASFFLVSFSSIKIPWSSVPYNEPESLLDTADSFETWTDRGIEERPVWAAGL